VFVQSISTCTLTYHTSASVQMHLIPRGLVAFTSEFRATASLNGSLYVNIIM